MSAHLQMIVWRLLMTMHSDAGQRQFSVDHSIDESDRNELLEHGKWLNDRVVNAAQVMLRRQFQSAVGLHDTLTVGNGSSTIAASAGMVQIFHDAANKHWLTVSTVHCPANYTNILCSLQRTPSNACIRAITAYCKFTGPYVTLCILNVCRQCGGSHCGLIAIAYLTNVLFGTDPVLYEFVRAHLAQCLQDAAVQPFPINDRAVRRQISHEHKIAL